MENTDKNPNTTVTEEKATALTSLEEAKKIFDTAKRPPNEALKPIDAGKLKGYTEINPLWRYEIMTQLFGLYGDGWKIEIVDNQIKPVEATKEEILFTSILLYTRNRVTGKWNAPAPATGSAYLIVKDRNGIHGNENAYASAQTDAIGKACKFFGIGYDVYLNKKNNQNQWQGRNNYNNPANYSTYNYNQQNNYNSKPQAAAPAPAAKPAQQANPTPAPVPARNTTPTASTQPAPAATAKPAESPAGKKETDIATAKKEFLLAIQDYAKILNITTNGIQEIIKEHFHKESSKEMTLEEIKLMYTELESLWQKTKQRLEKK